MLIIGLDYHPSFQQIASVDNETGEYGERQLLHKDGEGERFYRELKQRAVKVRIGVEATELPPMIGKGLPRFLTRGISPMRLRTPA